MYVGMLETESDREVYGKLYEENVLRLFHIARHIVRNDADAEDAVQMGFLKIAEKFAKYRYLPYVELVRLCTAIVRNAAYDIAREYQKEGEFTNETGLGEDYVPDSAPDVLEQMIEEHEKDLIAQALLELPDDEREILYIRYNLNLKPKETADLLNMSSAEVRKKLLRGRNRLAKIMERTEYESLRCRKNAGGS